MSRSYKDVPSQYRFPENDWRYGTEEIKYEAVGTYWGTEEKYNRIGTWYKDIPGFKTKKKKHADTEWRWMGTPMWWIRIWMNRPQRARGKAWEKKVMKVEIENIIDVDIPGVGRKPHIYYW